MNEYTLTAVMAALLVLMFAYVPSHSEAVDMDYLIEDAYQRGLKDAREAINNMQFNDEFVECMNNGS